MGKEKVRARASHKNASRGLIVAAGALSVIAVVMFAMILWAIGGRSVAAATTRGATAGTAGPVQEVRMSVEGYQYSPQQLTIKAGQPVRFIVDGTNASGCARSFVIPSLGVSRQLAPGENVFEFTPDKAGTIPFSCAMGMVRGQFIVTGADGKAPAQANTAIASPGIAGACHMGGGCGCGGA